MILFSSVEMCLLNNVLYIRLKQGPWLKRVCGHRDSVSTIV